MMTLCSLFNRWASRGLTSTMQTSPASFTQKKSGQPRFVTAHPFAVALSKNRPSASFFGRRHRSPFLIVYLFAVLLCPLFHVGQIPPELFCPLIRRLL